METMISPQRALELVLEATPTLQPAALPVSRALGATLAQEVVAPRDFPAFARATMDGYAVRLCDAGGKPRLAGLLPAGRTWDAAALGDGQCIQIMTGAPCPAGTQAVVPVEETQRENGLVQLPKKIKPMEYIVPAGSECARGAVAVRRGQVITPLVLATLLQVGCAQVLVTAPPALAIITTGEELTQPGRPLKPGKIYDTNGPMLAAMAAQAGVRSIKTLRARDRRGELVRSLQRAAGADIVVLVGGVSMGVYDLVPGVLEEAGAQIIFHKVAQRPGKPLLLARRGEQLIFGLPGNPLSCHVCFHGYVQPAMRKMMGQDPAAPRGVGRLTRDYTVRGNRAVLQLVRVEMGLEGWMIYPLEGQGSGDLFAVSTANALMRVDPAAARLPKGQRVAFEWLTLGAG